MVKVKVEVICESANADKIAELIASLARTGKIGDGKRLNAMTVTNADPPCYTTPRDSTRRSKRGLQHRTNPLHFGPYRARWITGLTAES